MSNIESLYPHNKKVFLEAIKNLKTHKKLGIVQATGTGKGKLASCFVEHVLKRKPNAKILILAPLHTILDNYRDNFGLTDSEVSFNTYKMLLSFDKTYLNNLGLTYDLIIVDEFHRLGAEKWGPAVKTIFGGVDNPKSICRVIGFTATPIRYLDNARDMSDELFGGNVIQGLNLEDAICEGILPGFVYNACYFSTEDKLAEVEKKLATNDYKIVDDTIRNDLMVKVKELRMLYHNKLKIENILKETTKDLGSTQKWIIFCRDKDSLDEIREICKSWFMSEPSLYVIHSDKYRSDNRRILKEFRESKSSVNVMLCIDMLNEGVHIKDIDGIIMLRKTDSPIIFLQQLGRALEAGKTTQPLIYDLVGNYKDLRIENSDGLVGNTISIVKGIADKVNKKRSSNCVIVRNFVEDFDNVMGELSQYLPGRPWTEEEMYLLKKYYPIGKEKMCQQMGLNRALTAIRNQACKQGLTVPLTWSDLELAILKEFYPIGGAFLCQEKGIDRDARTIMKYASDMKIKYIAKSWSEEEDKILKEFYPIGGVNLCLEKGLNHRGASSVQGRAHMLGLHTNNQKAWTLEEDAIIKEFYPSGGSIACQINGLSYRKIGSISYRAQRLGVYYSESSTSKAWSKVEIDLLKRYYPIGGPNLCVEHGLNRSTTSMKTKANSLGLAFDARKYTKWSPEDDNILKQYYPIGGYKLCQEKGLNSSYSQSQIAGRAKVLGLSVNIPSIRSRELSETEIDLLKKYYPIGGSQLCIEKGLNKTVSTIKALAKTYGLRHTVGGWTPEEDALLRKYYSEGGSKACIKAGVSRSKDAINSRAKILGLSYLHMAVWEDYEIKILLEYYQVGGYKLCIENGVNRSEASIRGKAKQLGLVYNNKN